MGMVRHGLNRGKSGPPDTWPASKVCHDHTTGRVRGLLCFNCNTVLGKMRDCPKVLRAAADYLENK